MTSQFDANRVKYKFQEHTGYIIHPSHTQASHNLMALGHTASVTPWRDNGVHQHTLSEEFYFLLNGRLQFLVQDFRITLQANEILMLYTGIPHAIIGGAGKIEHFGIRTPAVEDKQVVGEIPQNVPLKFEEERLLSGDWGHRIPLDLPQHQNCWLIGAGSARFTSQHLIMAYLDFPTAEAANAGIGTRHQLHYHQKSWEYYVVLHGIKTLQVDDELVSIEAGEILAVPPQVKHTLHSREAPYKGVTIRVPVELNDKIVVSA